MLGTAPDALLTVHCMGWDGGGGVSSIDMLPGAILTVHCMALYRVGWGGGGGGGSPLLTCYLVPS